MDLSLSSHSLWAERSQENFSSFFTYWTCALNHNCILIWVDGFSCITEETLLLVFCYVKRIFSFAAHRERFKVLHSWFWTIISFMQKKIEMLKIGWRLLKWSNESFIKNFLNFGIELKKIHLSDLWGFIQFFLKTFLSFPSHKIFDYLLSSLSMMMVVKRTCGSGHWGRNKVVNSQRVILTPSSENISA